MDYIIEKANNWIRFPSNPIEMNKAKILQRTCYTSVTVIGALDCIHVQIKKPSLFDDECINCKGYPSINVQVTCEPLKKSQAYLLRQCA